MKTKDKILQYLIQNHDFVSGQRLVEQFGISRSAVWKGINGLREEGIHIESITNRGYKLQEPERVLCVEEMKESRKDHKIGCNLLYFDCVESTNDTAKELALSGEQEGTVVVADKQSSGRGRRGRVWQSPQGGGLWFSILLRPAIAPEQAPCITLLAGMAVCHAIRKLTGLQAGIKWPNDILFHDKKLCGILTEMGGELEQVHYVVVGIGINVNISEFTAELQSIASSLSQETGKAWSRTKLLLAVLQEFEQYYQIYLTAKNFAPFREEYIKLCDTLGCNISVSGKACLTGLAEDITENGELQIRLPNGEKHIVYSGEVSVRRQEEVEWKKDRC